MKTPTDFIPVHGAGNCPADWVGDWGCDEIFSTGEKFVFFSVFLKKNSVRTTPHLLHPDRQIHSPNRSATITLRNETIQK